MDGIAACDFSWSAAIGPCLPNLRVYAKESALANIPLKAVAKIPMFSGTQEILLIVLIVVGIFLVPRMIKPRPALQTVALRRPTLRFSWTLRLAVVLSILWPVACALYFKPWLHTIIPFSIIGIGPVVVGWSLNWVVAGMRNKH